MRGRVRVSLLGFDSHDPSRLGARDGDDAEAGLERMGAGLAAYRRTGATLALPWFLGMLAEAQRPQGSARPLPRRWTMPWLWLNGQASASTPPSCIGCAGYS